MATVTSAPTLVDPRVFYSQEEEESNSFGVYEIVIFIMLIALLIVSIGVYRTIQVQQVTDPLGNLHMFSILAIALTSLIIIIQLVAIYYENPPVK